MNTYFIKYTDNQVSIFEYEDEQLVIIRNKGEISQEFQVTSFWKWFKKK